MSVTRHLGTVVSPANLVTLSRLLLSPVLFAMVLAAEDRGGASWPAFLLGLALGASDYLDGVLARHRGIVSRWGAFLDPLADKLLLVSAFITLGVIDVIPASLMITVLVRDVVIMGGYLFAAAVMDEAMAMEPTIWGKATTFTQIVTVALVLLDLAGWVVVSPDTMFAAFVITAVATVVSGIHYVALALSLYQAEG